MWLSLGGVMTSAMFYLTRKYSHHCVHQCYLTADGQRIGFQTLNMFGYPGRKVEVSINNAKAFSRTNMEAVLKRKQEQRLKLEAAREAFANGTGPPVTEDGSPVEENLLQRKVASVFPIFAGKGSTMSVVVKGFEGNVLLEEGGTYYENERLLHILTAQPDAEVVRDLEKEKRANFRKDMKKKVKK